MRFISFLLLSLLCGCAGVAGYTYHGPEGDRISCDCGAQAGDMRAGFVRQILGRGNAVEIKTEEVDALFCSEEMAKESLYLIGPVIPFIPLFGFGANEEPEEAAFVILNRSPEASLELHMDRSIRWIRDRPGEGSAFSEAGEGTGSLSVPPGGVLRIREPWSDRLSYRLTAEDGAEWVLQFSRRRGVFFVLTG